MQISDFLVIFVYRISFVGSHLKEKTKAKQARMFSGFIVTGCFDILTHLDYPASLNLFDLTGCLLALISIFI